MYRLLLSWRYLRSRYIALASIVSVTLGVATLIVVNSVMAGFAAEMHARLHGILSDLTFESPGLEGIPDPHWHMDQIRETLGNDVAEMTPVVRVPAMLHLRYRGQAVTQQVVLVGVDAKTYGKVSDFSRNLLNSRNRESLSFLLQEDGYTDRLPPSGWSYRREWAAYRAFADQASRTTYDEVRESETASGDPARPSLVRVAGGVTSPKLASEPAVVFAPLPAAPPTEEQLRQIDKRTNGIVIGRTTRPAEPSESLAATDTPPARTHSESSSDQAEFGTDPRDDSFPPRFRADVLTLDEAAVMPMLLRSERAAPTFNPEVEQHPGIILGISLCGTRMKADEAGEVEEWFLTRPGDDVQVTFPTSGTPPRPISASFTLVDLYESKMSEYDSSFAFVPIDQLQNLRGMVDPASGVRSVTSIQIKLRDGANLIACRDKLRERFPADRYPYRVQSWMDLQGPLLSAVQLETTILNILLFLIIAVAGFGILATFFMIVVEKTRDIGILKSLGAGSGGVMSIFLSYGLILGLVGAGTGLGGGLLFVHFINDIARVIEWITGTVVFDPTIYYFQQIPTIVDPLTLVWVTVGSVAIAVLASVLPAIRAARLHPVEALRYE